MLDTAPTTSAPQAPPTSAPAPSTAPTPPAPTQTEPTAPTGSQAPAQAEPTTQEPPPPSVSPKDWDGWDKLDWDKLDSVPEHGRGWVSEAAKRLRAQQAEATSALEKQVATWRSMYDALVIGDEDPRVSELTGKLNVREAAYKTLADERKALQARLDDYIKADAQRAVDLFQKKHGERLAADPSFATATRELFTLEDPKDPSRFFEPMDAADVVLAGPAAVEQAKKNFAAGWPIAAIVEVARASAVKAAADVPVTPKPRPSAEIVAGAAGTVTTKAPADPPLSHDVDPFIGAVERALKRKT